MKTEAFVIGVDYGTDSVRAVVMNAHTGEEVGSAVHYYTRWKEGKYCDPTISQFRQHPLDYLEGLENSVTQALRQCPTGTATKVKGISLDTTGSTPVAVNKEGVPLSLLPKFAHNPHGMFILWKDHTANKEAEEINELAHSGRYPDFTKYVGGIYSSEWFWAKVLRTLRVDKEVAEAAFSWVEHCDWIAAELTGNTDPSQIKRSRCAAGHKAMWHDEFEGLPSENFLQKLDSKLKGVRSNLFSKTFTADQSAGVISSMWAHKLGLFGQVIVGIGAFDAHMGAVGAQIEPYYLTKVMGTSTCDMLIAPTKDIGSKLIKGICGQVDGSIVPGMMGMEAGQSAYGDLFAWFRDLLLWPAKNIGIEINIESIKDKIIPALSVQAALIPLNESNIVSLDWINGRRTPDANHEVKSVIAGLNLGSTAPAIFKSLVEATAFGSRAIVERFEGEGVPINGVIALGGVARKSSYAMQVLADVLNRKIRISKSDNACALGAAMFASVAAGIHPTIEVAQKAMGPGFEKEYTPNSSNIRTYDVLYAKYKKVGQLTYLKSDK